LGTDFQNKKKQPAKRVLVAPLDWGLGHATRCIPIINTLKINGIDVLLAGEGPSLEILVKIFPGTPVLPLEGYRVRYSRNRALFLPKLFAQSIRIKKRIKKEHTWLRWAIDTYAIDAVISDNRFGLWSSRIPSVFITHQLQIKTGFKLLDLLATPINYRFIKKFSACWVADVSENENLAGDLSHPKGRVPFPYQYIALLSRFCYSEAEKKGTILFMLSGPEPARTSFENRILQQASQIPKPMILIRGLPGERALPKNIPDNLTVFNHAEPSELSRMIAGSEMLVCRAGYSTLMDLCALKKQAVIIPTPGQTEQEYLAKYLHQKKLFMRVEEKHFTKEQIKEALEVFPFSNNWPRAGLNEGLVLEFIAAL